MKHGTILRNLWQPSYESYLVYIGTSGRYALCLWLVNGHFMTSAFTLEKFFKNDILTDREHFPIVGYVPIEKIVHDVIIEKIGEQEHD